MAAGCAGRRLHGRAGAETAVAEVAGAVGRLDVLVNNVGGLIGEPAKLARLDHDDELFEQNLFLNLTSAYYATRAALPQMVAGGYGRVITIGSGYATHGGGMISYSAAKHGLVGFTHALAYQVPAGITVNCLCPGWTNTAVLGWGGPRGAPRPRRQSEGPHRAGPGAGAGGAGPDGGPAASPEGGRDHRPGDQRRRRLQGRRETRPGR